MHQADIEINKVYGNAKGLFRLVVDISMEISPKIKQLSKCVTYVQRKSVSGCIEDASPENYKVMSMRKFSEWAQNKFQGDTGWLLISQNFLKQSTQCHL